MGHHKSGTEIIGHFLQKRGIDLRADGSRELDSEEFSARNRNSCNLRENEIALTACSNHAGEFFNRIDPQRSVVTVPYRAGQECLGVRRQRWSARLAH